MRPWLWASGVLVALLVGSCGATTVGVADGSYAALVPTMEQLEHANASDIPGGFAVLASGTTGRIELLLEGDAATFRLDGAIAAARTVADRITVVDSEGSGPFKAHKEVLDLGTDALTLGALTIDHPVIWPGSFEDSPVVTLKPWNPDERGPAVSCRADETCLLLTAPLDPAGSYADANDPALNQNPIAAIDITADSIEYTLDTGKQVRSSRDGASTVRACGLAESLIWAVPATVGLALDEPVLVHTPCPSTPGSAIQLVIMERSEVPALAPLGESTDGGDWCSPGTGCLWFVPE